MQTLTYSGEQTVDVQGAQDVIEALAETQQADTDITVSSVSLRFRGDDIHVSVSIEARSDADSIESVRDSLTETATALGFENQTDPTDGVTLL